MLCLDRYRSLALLPFPPLMIASELKTRMRMNWKNESRGFEARFIFYLKDNELLGGEGVFIQVFGAGVWDSRRIDWRNINLLVGSWSFLSLFKKLKEKNVSPGVKDTETTLASSRQIPFFIFIGKPNCHWARDEAAGPSVLRRARPSFNLYSCLLFGQIYKKP